MDGLLRDFNIIHTEAGFDGLKRLIAVNETPPNDMKQEFSFQKLLQQLMAVRGPWTRYLPHLRDRVVKLLTVQGVDGYVAMEDDIALTCSVMQG